MAARDSFLLRIDPKVLAAMRRWAEDDLRSVNGQIEFILREAVTRRRGGAENHDARQQGDESSE